MSESSANRRVFGFSANLKRVRKRPVSLIELKSDVVISAMVRVELRRHMQEQVKSEVRHTITGDPLTLLPDPRVVEYHKHKFSKAPNLREWKPSFTAVNRLCKIGPGKARISHIRTQSAVSKPKASRSGGWVSPFDQREITCFQTLRPNVSPDLSVVACQFPSYARSTCTSPTRLSSKVSPVSSASQTPYRKKRNTWSRQLSTASSSDGLMKQLRLHTLLSLYSTSDPENLQ